MRGESLEWTAAILVGGRGTRLRPAVADCPKVLAPVGGRPFLAHLLDQLTPTGLREIVLLAGHRAGQLRDVLGDTHKGIRLRYSVEEMPLGTAGALRHALPLLHAPTVLLLNGDSYCDVDLAAFTRQHRERASVASLVLTRVEDTSRFGQVRMADDDRVLRFEEKSQGGPGWINAGIYLFQRQQIAVLPASHPLSLERDVLPGWVAEGSVLGFRYAGRFLDIGTPESYAAADHFFEPVAGPGRPGA
jgi:NDP-sugar pyrophosphorylase family protein